MERASGESKADVNFILDEIGSHPGGSKSDRREGSNLDRRIHLGWGGRAQFDFFARNFMSSTLNG